MRDARGLGGDGRGRDGVAVKNGTLGTVLDVASGGERLTVRLDGPEKGSGREVTFYTRDYAHIDHGYAATVHKAQGVTVDRAHVLATPHMDRHAAYVGLTRHRDGVELHYAREDFADQARLACVLGRERAKDTPRLSGSRWRRASAALCRAARPRPAAGKRDRRPRGPRGPCAAAGKGSAVAEPVCRVDAGG